MSHLQIIQPPVQRSEGSQNGKLLSSLLSDGGWRKIAIYEARVKVSCWKSLRSVDGRYLDS
jgi:hypothetical protein